MPRRIDCPYPDIEAFIELPDIWLGIHADRRDETIDKIGDQYGRTLQTFGISLALLDDWLLPGLNGNPEKWDFKELDLKMIAWVSSYVMGDFLKCWAVPKESPPQLQAGLNVAVDVEENN